MLDGAIGQMKAILRGSEDNAIATFNASHRAIKDAIKRAAELEQALTEPRLHDLERARKALARALAFLSQEPDITDELRTRAAALEDLLARETFFKELPAIEQHTQGHRDRVRSAASTRRSTPASPPTPRRFDKLVKTPGWAEIDEDQQQPPRRARSSAGTKRDAERVPIPQLRADRDACDGRLRAAVAELRRIIDGERVVTVSVGSYFAGGIETEEQLDAALDGIREECARLIGAGKKVIVQ